MGVYSEQVSGISPGGAQSLHSATDGPKKAQETINIRRRRTGDEGYEEKYLDSVVERMVSRFSVSGVKRGPRKRILCMLGDGMIRQEACTYLRGKYPVSDPIR